MIRYIDAINKIRYKVKAKKVSLSIDETIQMLKSRQCRHQNFRTTLLNSEVLDNANYYTISKLFEKFLNSTVRTFFYIHI